MITFFPDWPTNWNAALFNTTQDDPTPTIFTVVCRPLSRLVTRTEVPIGNSEENAPGAPPTADNPTVAPSHTTCPTTPEGRTRDEEARVAD